MINIKIPPVHKYIIWKSNVSCNPIPESLILSDIYLVIVLQIHISKIGLLYMFFPV